MAVETSEAAAAWAGRSLADLIAPLVGTFHRPLPVMFDDAERELRSVGSAATAALAALDELRSELVAHMEKEEQILFPWILSARGHTAGTPIRVMQLEHRDTLERLEHTLALARAALGDADRPHLDALERSLRTHIELEEDVLFPRALAPTR